MTSGAAISSPPRERSFVFLLAALLCLCLLVPVIGAVGREIDSRVLAFGVGLLFAVMIISAIYAVSTKPRTLLISLALAGPASVLRLSSPFVDSLIILSLGDTFDMLFVGYVLYELLKYLFSDRPVSMNMIAASLCAYLLIGVWFASAFALIEALSPGSFRVPEHIGPAFADDTSGTALYYSLVTLTTLGYGDIVPMHGVARMLAGVEAVIGQIYLAVLVARLVGLHIATRARSS